jgi:periplasmic protein TonB
MWHIALRILVALLTFVVGITISSLLSFKRAVTIRSVPASSTTILVEAPSPDKPSACSHEFHPPYSVVSGGILNGKAISKPMPAYPPIAKAARIQGTVTVEIVVGEDGNVVSATAVSGPPVLQAAAVAAAQQAKFSPTRLSGEPVKVSGTITYNFVLE